jgi:hypothetical protein
MRTYREATLADKLRAYMAADTTFSRAVEALDGTDAAAWCHDERAAYLRGYDDRQPEIDALQAELAAARQEFAEWLGASRKALDTHAALQERVRELESTILDEHSRLAQEEAKPAAVGVVGYGITDGRLIGPWIDHTRERAEQRLRVSRSYTNVVAILNADLIAQPAQERDG